MATRRESTLYMVFSFVVGDQGAATGAASSCHAGAWTWGRSRARRTRRSRSRRGARAARRRGRSLVFILGLVFVDRALAFNGHRSERVGGQQVEQRRGFRERVALVGGSDGDPRLDFVRFHRVLLR